MTDIVHPSWDDYSGVWETHIYGEQRLVTVDGADGHETDPTFHCTIVIPFYWATIGCMAYRYEGVHLSAITRPTENTLWDEGKRADQNMYDAQRKHEEAQAEMVKATRTADMIQGLAEEFTQ